MVDGAFGREAYLPNAYVPEQLPALEAEPASDGVARLYRLPGAKGSIGLISPVSAHFCGACNRIRITADGKVMPCLHSAAEYSLKGLGRDAMAEVLKTAILNKPARHAALSATEASEAGRSMNRIGG